MEEKTEPVLEGYLGKDVAVFIDHQDLIGEFAGYDSQAYYLRMYGELITINRSAVEIIIPAIVWEKMKEEENV